MKNKMVVIIGILLVFVLSFILLNKKNDVVVSAQSNNEIIEKSNNNSSEVKEKKVKVDIKGAVKKPGVYEVNSDNRVIDQTTPNMIQRIIGIFERKPLISKEI